MKTMKRMKHNSDNDIFYLIGFRKKKYRKCRRFYLFGNSFVVKHLMMKKFIDRCKNQKNVRKTWDMEKYKKMIRNEKASCYFLNKKFLNLKIDNRISVLSAWIVIHWFLHCYAFRVSYKRQFIEIFFVYQHTHASINKL